MRRFEQRIRTWASRLEDAGAEAANASARRGAELARNSAPVDSGELRSSIGVRDGAVLAQAQHAAAVEYGTSRMAARPFMLPMARRMGAEFARECSAKLREVLK